MNEDDPVDDTASADDVTNEAQPEAEEATRPLDSGESDLSMEPETGFSVAEPEAESPDVEPEAGEPEPEAEAVTLVSDAEAGDPEMEPAPEAALAESEFSPGLSEEMLAAAAISDELRARTAEEHARHVERIVPTCCRFKLGGQDYFLRIEYMLEIADFLDVTVIPLAPHHIRGLVNLRGDAIPVIDLARLRGVPLAPSPDYRLIITDAGGERLAFIVEGIPVLSREMEGEEVDVVQFVQNFRVGVS